MAAKPRILHVEDDENDSVLFQLSLAHVGFTGEYRRVADGQQAMAYLQGEGAYGDRARNPLPDLIVCDLKLPRVSGFEFIRWLRSQPQFAQIPVVTLSGSDETKDKSTAANLGVRQYLVKSSTVSETEAQARTIVALAQSPPASALQNQYS